MITPEDADGMFDLLTYQKGGSVLRMLERWLGADAFRAGVRAYLDRYQLSNTETTDLWDSLESATGQPVRRIMDSWIFQPGFPLVTAERDGDRVTISQQRFTYEGADGRASSGRSRCARASKRRRRPRRARSLLADPALTIDVPADALVVLDAGGEGFYRVAYPPEWRDAAARRGRARTARTVLPRRRLLGRRCSRAARPAEELLDLARPVRATRTTSSCGACS